ncbi:hypothetical protein [Colwellia sp. E2M01]|uniref:hypothetical protein n=1 Tax=Colwellia sp. E2M01 TaxID=2841561 RepID=UPI001C080FBB|nr:hypothetical protein [Colwellia sp. E2M01]MBU2871144.1 hypothetical protein [Colwellia sp. E2M01]
MEAKMYAYGQYFLNNALTKNKTDNKTLNMLKTIIFKNMFLITPSITIVGLVLSSLLATSFTANANTLSITAEMSPEVVAEYNKQLASNSWPEMHTKLALMDNPYAKQYKVLRKALRKEAPEGKRKRLMTHEESLFMAKKMRFDYCQASVSFFVDFSQRAFDLSTTEQNPLTKEQLMQGNGVAYPFTEAEKNNPSTRPPQIALDLGWKYKGQGKARAKEFLATCLAIPVELYYKEDK